ncbi:MAG TPA: divalent-cation tolerance protein CutA [Paucimonas sp.]|nr:divalent-cation tolerance protein CutA [Paucimonas sp.]
MSDEILVITNVPDAAHAQAIARLLVERRLAACVNILPAVQSVYQWQGAVEEASEVTLLIKTVMARYAELEAAIKGAHPYQVPEIVALPIAAGLPAYLNWIAQETKKDVHG